MTDAELRFRVLTCNGWLEPEVGGRDNDKVHLSAMVYDRAYDCVLATYRSEDQEGYGTTAKRDTALLVAQDHVDRLNAQEAL